jgi:hypothetical protein
MMDGQRVHRFQRTGSLLRFVAENAKRIFLIRSTRASSVQSNQLTSTPDPVTLSVPHDTTAQKRTQPDRHVQQVFDRNEPKVNPVRRQSGEPGLVAHRCHHAREPTDENERQ